MFINSKQNSADFLNFEFQLPNLPKNKRKLEEVNIENFDGNFTSLSESAPKKHKPFGRPSLPFQEKSIRPQQIAIAKVRA